MGFGFGCESPSSWLTPLSVDSWSTQATIFTHRIISLGLAHFKIWGFRMKSINLCFVLCLEASLFTVYFGGTAHAHTFLNSCMVKMRRSWEKLGKKSKVRTYCKKRNRSPCFWNKDSLVQTSGPLRIWRFSSWNVLSHWNVALGPWPTSRWRVRTGVGT